MDQEMRYASMRRSPDDLKHSELLGLVRLQDEHIKILEGQIAFLHKYIKRISRTNDGHPIRHHMQAGNMR